MNRWFAYGVALGIVVTGGIGLAHQDLVLEPQMDRMSEAAQGATVRELELRRLLRAAESRRELIHAQALADAKIGREVVGEWRWRELDQADQLHQTYLRHLHAAELVPKITHEGR